MRALLDSTSAIERSSSAGIDVSEVTALSSTGPASSTDPDASARSISTTAIDASASVRLFDKFSTRSNTDTASSNARTLALTCRVATSASTVLLRPSPTTVITRCN